MHPAAWGVDEGYFDYRGEWRPAPDATVRAILAQFGATTDDARPGPAPVRVVTVEGGRVAGGGGDVGGDGVSAVGVDRPCELRTEDGSTVRLDPGGRLPDDLPLGYHDLVALDDGARTRLIAAPPACHLPDDLFTWGWTVQLYAARSAASWGIGDLADLARLAEWSAGELGAGFLAVNPLHAPLPTLPQEPSPYFPSSRRYRNPLYLRVEDVPGAAEALRAGPWAGGTGGGARADRLVGAVDDLAAAGRALNHHRRIDRDEVFRLKMTALSAAWDRFTAAGSDAGFDRWREAEGDSLADYATFCALAEHYEGRPWPEWDPGHRHPGCPAVARFAETNAHRVGFHAWLQWLLDRQLGRASAPVAVMHDLAIGVDPAGADAWCWQDVMALGFGVGAPPDEFNTRGQDWGVAPFDPWRLRATGYEAFAATLRAGLRHAGGLRVDHVMGLFRLFWVPPDEGPAAGTYVRYPAHDLLSILALESVRAGAFVVGEDLGTVEPEAREQLARRRVMSYRLLWFEPSPPAAYPRHALAAVTTHDLPTVAGLWTGADVEAQRQLDLAPNEEATAALRQRLVDDLGVAPDAPPGEVVPAVHARLAEAPSALLSATLDDALEVPERPNMPGTTGGWPNWSLALPLPLEAVVDDPRPRAIAASLRRDGRTEGDAAAGP